MPSCYSDPATRYEEVGKFGKTIKGGFSAPTRIGFNAVSFEYTSKVTYVHPCLPVNLYPTKENNWCKGLRWRVATESDSSRIFSKLKSEWRIVVDPAKPANGCIVDYTIEMEFASALYAAVTN